jgi:hypothetical protein
MPATAAGGPEVRFIVILVLMALFFSLSGNERAARSVVGIIVWGVAGGVALAAVFGVWVMSSTGH